MTTSAPPLDASAPARRPPRTGGGPVLVAATPTVASNAPFTAAQLVAGRLGVAVEVLSVLEPLPIHRAMADGAGPATAGLEQERVAHQRAAMEHRMRTAIAPAPAWPLRIASGPPARTIAALAAERAASLVVMGLGDRRSLHRLLGRECTVEVFRLAGRPVLGVGHEFYALPRRVVVGMDFGPSSIAAARRALAIVAPMATVTLAHVAPAVDLRQPGGGEWERRYAADAQAELDRVRASLDVPRGVAIETVTVIGDPATQLVGVAERLGADLIAVGRNGHSLAERLFVGSVTASVLRGASCAVLASPEPPEARREA